MNSLSTMRSKNIRLFKAVLVGFAVFLSGVGGIELKPDIKILAGEDGGGCENFTNKLNGAGGAVASSSVDDETRSFFGGSSESRGEHCKTSPRRGGRSRFNSRYVEEKINNKHISMYRPLFLGSKIAVGKYKCVQKSRSGGKTRFLKTAFTQLSPAQNLKIVLKMCSKFEKDFHKRLSQHSKCRRQV